MPAAIPRAFAVLCLSILLGCLAFAEEPARDVYLSTVRSTAWVINNKNVRESATGWLVDHKRRLLVTHLNAVGNEDEAQVIFPVFEDGKLVVARTAYQKGKPAVAARVIHREPRCGLAVLELESVPEGITEMKLAPAGAAVGDGVHIIGNPLLSTGLWVLNSGSVRQVYQRKVKTRTGEIDARVVETQTPYNAGDGGGPVVNDRGELVAVVESAAGGTTQLVTFCIDVSEVRDLAARGRDLAGKLGPRGASKVLVELLGLRVTKPSTVLVEQLGLPRERGLLIEYIRPNSAADQAGLRLHDILLEVDGKPLSSNASEFPAILASIKPNTPVPAIVVRKGRQETIKALTRPPDKVE